MSTLRLALLSLLAVGCAHRRPPPPWAPRSDAGVLTFEAEPTDAPVEVLITFEVRLIEVDEDLAREWAGEGDALRVVFLPRPRLHEILAELDARQRVRKPIPPRVTVFAGHETELRLQTERSWVEDRELTRTEPGGPERLAPVRGTLLEGQVLRLKGDRTASGRLRVQLRIERAVTEEIAVITREHAGRPVEFEVPRQRLAQDALELELEPEGTVLISFPEPGAAGEREMLLLWASATILRPG